jgi:hypothetical protein
MLGCLTPLNGVPGTHCVTGHVNRAWFTHGCKAQDACSCCVSNFSVCTGAGSSSSNPGHFTLSAHSVRDWMGAEISVDALKKTKIPSLQEMNNNSPLIGLVCRNQMK